MKKKRNSVWVKESGYDKNRGSLGSFSPARNGLGEKNLISDHHHQNRFRPPLPLSEQEDDCD